MSLFIFNMCGQHCNNVFIFGDFFCSKVSKFTVDIDFPVCVQCSCYQNLILFLITFADFLGF